MNRIGLRICTSRLTGLILAVVPGVLALAGCDIGHPPDAVEQVQQPLEGEPVTSGLVSSWRFNETGGPTAADSVGAHPGTLTNGATFDPAGGKIGGGVLADGVDDHVNVPYREALNPSGSFSVSFWMKTSGFNSAESYLYESGIWNQKGFIFEDYGTLYGPAQFAFEVYTSGNACALTVARSVVGDDAWHHVVGTRTGSTQKLYIDGTLRSSKTNCVAYTRNNSEPAKIARMLGGGGAGRMDIVKVFNRALSAAEVTSLHQDPGSSCACASGACCDGCNYRPATDVCRATAGVCDVEERCSGSSATCPTDAKQPSSYVCRATAGACDLEERCDGMNVTCAVDQHVADGMSCSPPSGGICQNGLCETGGGGGEPIASGLVSSWRLDETSGTTAADSAGANPGTLTNGATFDLAGGKSGGAVLVDGVDDSVNVPYRAALNPSASFSVSFWMRSSGFNSAESYLYESGLWNQKGFIFEDYGTEYGPPQFAFEVYSSGNTCATSVARSVVGDGAWHHVAGTRTGSIQRLYIDGALRSSNTGCAAYAPNNSEPAKIGRMLGGGGAGRMDIVKLFNRELSAAEVTTLYQSPGGDGGGGSSYTIAGHVSAAGGATATMLLSPGGATTTSNANGDYSIGGLAAGSYTITPSASSCTFSPSSRNAVITSANISGVDFTATCDAVAGPRITTFTASGPITAAPGQVISALSISNPSGPCITVNGAANVHIVDCVIGPCGGGTSDYGNSNIKTTGATGLLVEHTRIFSGTRAFIAQGGSNITFRKNLVQGPFNAQGLFGGVEYDQVNGGTVDGNVITGQFPGDVISMYESSNMSVTRNDLDVSIVDPSGAGFTMGDSTTGNPGHDNYVAYNTVIQQGGVPAGVFGSTGNTVLEKNCLRSGIQAYNYSGVFAGVTVRYNVINMGASFVPDTSVIAQWSTNIDSTDCSLVPP